MTVWLQRGEAKYIELINNSNWALINLFKKDKKPIMNYEIVKHSLNKLNLGPHESQHWGWLQKRAQGRYIREMGYALECLNLADSVKLDITINDLNDFFKEKIKEKIQSYMKSRNYYTPTNNGYKLSELEYCSKEWANFLQKLILSYGYFCRYLDIVIYLQSKKGRFSLKDISNNIGPKEFVIKGGGPEFIQSTFLTWGYYLDIFDILTRTGKSLENDLSKKLNQLRSNDMAWTKKYDRLSPVRKDLNFKIKNEPEKEIRVPQFFRLAINNSWNNLDKRNFLVYPFTYKNAVIRASTRTILIQILNKYFNKEVELSFLIKVIKDKNIPNSEKDIKEDMKYIECTGIKLVKKVENKELIYKPLRRPDLNDFTKYLPDGWFLKW